MLRSMFLFSDTFGKLLLKTDKVKGFDVPQNKNTRNTRKVIVSNVHIFQRLYYESYIFDVIMILLSLYSET